MVVGPSVRFMTVVVYSGSMCHCDRSNKQAEWPIVEHDKVRHKRQTENYEMRKGRVRGVPRQTENESNTQMEQFCFSK